MALDWVVVLEEVGVEDGDGLVGVHGCIPMATFGGLRRRRS